MVGLLEALSVARSFAIRRGENHDSSPRDGRPRACPNAVGGLFQAYAGSGSFTRSGVNAESGARSPLSAMFGAGFLAAILLLIAPLAAHVPDSRPCRRADPVRRLAADRFRGNLAVPEDQPGRSRDPGSDLRDGHPGQARPRHLRWRGAVGGAVPVPLVTPGHRPDRPDRDRRPPPLQPRGNPRPERVPGGCPLAPRRAALFRAPSSMVETRVAPATRRAFPASTSKCCRSRASARSISPARDLLVREIERARQRGRRLPPCDRLSATGRAPARARRPRETGRGQPAPVQAPTPSRPRSRRPAATSAQPAMYAPSWSAVRSRLQTLARRVLDEPARVNDVTYSSMYQEPVSYG